MHKVAVIGLGTVGRAQVRMFGGPQVISYDPATGTPYPQEAIARSDMAVIAVGTPPAADGSADVSSVYEAVARLPGRVPVLIRSTVPPGTTDAIAAGRPGLTACAPEFLHEREGGPWRESRQVPWMLLGGVKPARAWLRPMLERVFPGMIHECTARQAELAKYIANIYWAARVTFVNEAARIAEAFGEDWGPVREAWLSDLRIAPAYTSMRGYEPGFGGRCWPKDLAALISASSEAGYKPQFLEAIEAANERFRRHE